MADVTDIPVIGGYLGFLGFGGQPKYTPKQGTLRGRTRTIDLRRGIKNFAVPEPASPVRSIGGDLLNDALAGFLGEIVRESQESAGRAPRTNQPKPPPPLPSPIVDIPPPMIGEPAINLPIELPEVIVKPPAPSTPAPVAEPEPLEVPFEEFPIEAQPIFPNPYAPTYPAVPSRVGSGSTVAARSPLRIDPILAGVLLQQLVPGVGSTFGNVLARPPNLARAPTPVSPIGAGPTGPAQPTPPGGTQVPIGTDLQPPATLTELQVISANAQPKRPSNTKDDDCQCEEKKPKKREPRPPRTKCYKGTFRQHAKGISYSRGEEIPCVPAPRTVSTKGKSLKGRAVSAATKYAKRGKAPKLGELARDIFGL